MSKAPLFVAGTIFGLIALLHLYRLYSHFSIVVGTTEIPVWANGVGFIIAAGLSYWMFHSAFKCCKCGCSNCKCDCSSCK